MSEYEIITVDATAYPTKLTRKYRERKPARLPDPSELRAVVPGRILEVLVSGGEAIEKGSPLVVLEAMKMQNTLMADAVGTVTKVHVEPGALVMRGDLLAEIEVPASAD
jgi:biotin carboxyl carrier protein